MSNQPDALPKEMSEDPLLRCVAPMIYFSIIFKVLSTNVCQSTYMENNATRPHTAAIGHHVKSNEILVP